MVALPRIPRRLLIAIILLVAFAGGLYVCAVSVTHLLQVPYNVRELFPDSYRDARIVLFSTLLVWIGFGPAWVGEFVARRPRHILLLPLWDAAIGLVSWGMLSFAVTAESLADVLGGQTLGWGGNWEFLGRFLALQGTVSLPLLVASVTCGSVYQRGWWDGLRNGLYALACVIPWLALSWAVVVVWANTDNLTELIRAKPSQWTGPTYLTLLMFLIAANVSVLSHAWARGRMVGKLASLLGTVLLIIPGWELLWLGLEPAVEKYGITFPAVRFLLGPNRETVLSLQELFARWSTVQIGAVAVLAVGSMIASYISRQPFANAVAMAADCSARIPANRDVPTDSAVVQRPEQHL